MESKIRANVTKAGNLLKGKGHFHALKGWDFSAWMDVHRLFKF